MKKLAIITTHPIQYYAPIFKLLSERKNIEVCVFYTWGEDALKDKFDEGFGKKIEWDIPLLEGYNYHFLENIAPDKGSHHFKGIDNPTIIEEIKNYNPDAILVFGWSYKSHLKVIRYFKNKIPIWFRGDSHLLDEISFHKKIARKLFLTWLYSYIDKAFFVGKNNKNYYKHAALNDKKLTFAPHAIDNSRFAETEKNIELAKQWRTELGIKENELVWLFAGKFESKKSPLLLLEAFIERQKQQNSKDNEKEHLIFLGNGELENQLKQKAESYQNIHFLPFQNQSKMPIVYLLCNVFILPSKGAGETWGLAINEAMAAKKAVIASTKVGCAIDLIQSNREKNNNGFIFQSENVESLKEAMNKIKSQRQAKEMGELSYQIIQNWSFEKIAQTIENNFE
ncbi:glycosyltransferase [Bernardetia litoralis DSM 6794]|uniref:Glycosyltransferase n=1 Tax=Bernardetia litoralis (strain ATCC 23117 / DSM 6794 / NBRC 15988 / NCIMB 1366 / Fx l1 / Sio-4) TaxID=880071 RepID=I4AK03_BERLS|nr:glycosyltransferase family 4 protein [Bernardetia litoralis]AFM04288.1 glycosyltransferase [Bernardetia litoralis DSM 6794]